METRATSLEYSFKDSMSSVREFRCYNGDLETEGRFWRADGE
jgi:hypothetical protein